MTAVGLACLTDGGQLLEVQAGAGLTQQIQPVVEQLGAGSRVQVLQLLDRDLGLHVDDAQDERRVLDLQGGESEIRKYWIEFPALLAPSGRWRANFCTVSPSVTPTNLTSSVTTSSNILLVLSERLLLSKYLLSLLLTCPNHASLASLASSPTHLTCHWPSL